MALATMLTSLRELILNDAVLPDSALQRRRLYAERFPKLSKEEISDLAAIDPAQLRIYTSTIYTGEARVIRHHYKMTLPYMERFWPDAYGEKFNLLAFMKRVQQRHPWKGYRTQKLVDAAFFTLRDAYPELQKVLPSILDIAQLERLNVLIKRSSPQKIPQSITKELLANMDVAAFLALNLIPNDSVQYQTFSYDVIRLYQCTYGNLTCDKEALLFQQQPVSALGFRNAQNRVIWLAVPQSFLECVQKERVTHLQEYAECCYEDLPGSSEEEKLHSFLALVQQLRQSGAVAIVS